MAKWSFSTGLPEGQRLVSELVHSLRATDSPITYRFRFGPEDGGADAFRTAPSSGPINDDRQTLLLAIGVSDDHRETGINHGARLP